MHIISLRIGLEHYCLLPVATSTNVHRSCENTENIGAVLGTGQAHILKDSWVVSRDAAFRHRNALFDSSTSGMIKDGRPVSAKFHFLNTAFSAMSGSEHAGGSSEFTINL